jgi:hypothetical protein
MCAAMNRKNSNETDGKIKNLMERTPGVLKSKFLSVLGNSSDLINGLSNKVCVINLEII